MSFKENVVPFQSMPDGAKVVGQEFQTENSGVTVPVTAADRDVINRMSEITNALSQKGSVAFTFMQVPVPLEQSKTVCLNCPKDQMGNLLITMYVKPTCTDQCMRCRELRTSELCSHKLCASGILQSPL